MINDHIFLANLPHHMIPSLHIKLTLYLKEHETSPLVILFKHSNIF